MSPLASSIIKNPGLSFHMPSLRTKFVTAGLVALAGCATQQARVQQDPAEMLNDAERLVVKEKQPVEAEKLIVGARAIYRREGDAQGLGLADRAYGDLLESDTVSKWEKYYRRRGFLERSVTFDNRLAKARDFYVRALQNFDVASTQYLQAAQYDRLINIYFNKAWSHVGLKETDQACRDFDRALEAHSQYLHINPSGKVSFPAGFKSMPDALAAAKRMAGCSKTSATHIVSLRLAHDFPSAASFYPLEAKARGEEGRATINACVDTTGHLTGEPSVVHSSGVASLDAAAVELAKAGSGHYLAPTENDIPKAGCGAFAIAFTLNGYMPALARGYPNPFSTLALRKSALDEQFVARMLEGTKSLRAILPQPQKLTLGDSDSVAFLRSQAAALAQQEVDLRAATSDYIAGMDALESAEDIPEQDRRAFRTEWHSARRLMLDRISQLTSSASSLSEIADEFGDYYEKGPQNPTPEQRAAIASMMQRGRDAVDGYMTALKRLQDLQSDTSDSSPVIPH